MQNITTYIIADDDPIHRELTSQHLLSMPDLQCLGAFSSAVEVINKLKVTSPDLLILDIQMPQISGLELAQNLKTAPLIIFITSHVHFAKEAFDVDAIDFLTKPFSPARLFRAIDKVKNLLEMRRNIQNHEAFNVSDNDSFFIKEKNIYVRIFFASVLYIESLSDFVMIYLNDGKKHIALANLKSVEQQLPNSSFIRISRSHIVNKNLVTSIDSSSVFIDKLQLTIGKMYMENVVSEIIGNSAIKRFI